MSEHSTTTASPTRTEAELRTLMARAVREVRETNPLAPSITNTVTQSFVANAQLAVGGSAAMVYLPDEGECVAALGGAVYINLGTLMPVYEQTVPATARACAAAATPWVLDPVGVGIGSLRTRLIEAVRENPPTILRGNASEIIAVADLLRRGREFASQTFDYFETYTVIALVYLIITLLLSKGVSMMEGRLTYYDRDRK